MKLFLLLLSLFVFLQSGELVSAKTLPQSKSVKPAIRKSTGGGNVTVSPRLRRDKKALVVSFGNLQSAKSVQYTLVYQTNGKDEGAGGVITPQRAINSTSRELLFGTCSSNVCRYHSGISNMRLEIVTELTSGKKSIKRYSIKI